MFDSTTVYGAETDNWDKCKKSCNLHNVLMWMAVLHIENRKIKKGSKICRLIMLLPRIMWLMIIDQLWLNM